MKIDSQLFLALYDVSRTFSLSRSSYWKDIIISEICYVSEISARNFKQAPRFALVQFWNYSQNFIVILKGQPSTNLIEKSVNATLKDPFHRCSFLLFSFKNSLQNRISRILFLDLPVIAGEKTETGQKNPSSFPGTVERFQRITYWVTPTDKLTGFD